MMAIGIIFIGLIVMAALVWVGTLNFNLSRVRSKALKEQELFSETFAMWAFFMLVLVVLFIVGGLLFLWLKVWLFIGLGVLMVVAVPVVWYTVMKVEKGRLTER